MNSIAVTKEEEDEESQSLADIIEAYSDDEGDETEG